MKTTHILSHILAVTLLWSVGGINTSRASDLLFNQLSDGQSTFGPSELWQPDNINSEVADDFDVVGNVDRVFASGFIWGTVDFQGVYIRFYEYKADGTPGILQKQYFINGGFNAGAIDVPLSPPFAATGKHFLSVQPISNYWYWWSSQSGAPRGQAFYFRNLAAGQTAWQHGDNLNLNTSADVTFSLYGSVTTAAQITGLNATTMTRSGYLEIFGSNFGGNGQVLIDGLPAPIATWEPTHIVTYVPEAARLTTVPVQVINASGLSSNTTNLTVTVRQANGRVNWRFRMNGPWSQVRPVIAADGTVYAIDVFDHLYALKPDGGLKWLVRGAGDKGIAVGGDGSVYVASESFINAFNPDGTTKWSFTQNPRAFICLGVSVGPDGNIYSVATEGMGVFSLTPQGTLRWTNPEGYARPIVDYGEIVFGPNGSGQQLYFYANNHIRAVRLNGSSVFSIPGGLPNLRPGFQPVVSPDGSMHTALTAFTPAGTTLWSFATPYPLNVLTTADIGSNGTHYFVQNLAQLFALNPDGSQRWHAVVAGNVDGPVVDPLNMQLVMGSSETGDHAGYILSASTANGAELWRVTLPIEDPTVFNPGVGIFGFNQFVDTRARFTADGSTAYIITATATGDNNTSKSFVYSLNTAASAPSPTPTVAKPVISPNGGSYVKSVQVTLSDTTSGATIYYTTNGTTPNTSSAVYTSPFVLTKSATVKARAVKVGMANSNTASAQFKMTRR